MKDKMTVKDLATELNVDSKELLKSVQQLGINAKTATSNIAEEDLERVRNHMKSQGRGNVIVRRRVAKPKTEEVKEVAQEKVVEAKKAPAKTEEKTVDKSSPTKKSTPKKAAEKPVPEAPKVARIVAKPTQDAPSPVEVVEVVEETKPTAETVKSDTLQKDLTKSGGSGVNVGATPDASAVPDDSSTPVFAAPKEEIVVTEEVSAGKESQAAAESAGQAESAPKNKKRERGPKKRPAQEEVQQVRVISRPTPEMLERQREVERSSTRDTAKDGRDSRPNRDGGRDGRGRPDSGRDSGRPGGRDGAPRGQAAAGDNRAPRPPRQGQPAGQNAGARFTRQGAGPGVDVNLITPGAAEGQSKKKRMKGRRTVDFQQGDFGRYGHDDEQAMRLGRTGKGRRKNKDTRQAQTSTTQPLKAAKRKIRVTEAIRVSDMAHQMGLKAPEIIKILFNLGVMATINQSLDIDTATLVAAEFEYEVEKAGFSEDDYLIPTEADKPEDLRPRPPVVTIMGHVDHGKTSLLDAIRKSNVTGGEAGGITQHIGAYHVRTKRGEIVFLDTPGHEAFTAMRARGAQVTDLVILVVAADDGVMEQTREAINHSKAAQVPIMVAVNKMDKEGADPDRVLRELAELGLQAEDWGGDTVTAKVSAKNRAGLDDLLELVALQAEILELKANPNKPARGRIVEAKLDKGRGPVATVLIQEGTLHQGDTFVCGVFSGRVRALFNDQGKKVKEAGPAIPVEVQGFDGVPEAGEEFVCVTDDRLARRIAEARAIKQRERHLAKESKVTLETFLARHVSDQEALTLNLVLKADVQGSLEAITEALNKKSTDKVRINVVHGGAGAISESDILLASASQAIIIGFNVRPTAKIKEIAEQENVDIRFYDIIYKLGDDITSAMQGMLAPVQREQYLGQADVRDTFSVPKIGVIAGCHVADGKVTRNAGVRLLRDGVVVYTGKISSLKRFKDDAREVLKGYECGIGLENYNDIKVGDAIEAFEMIEEAATL